MKYRMVKFGYCLRWAFRLINTYFGNFKAQNSIEERSQLGICKLLQIVTLKKDVNKRLEYDRPPKVVTGITVQITVPVLIKH